MRRGDLEHVLRAACAITNPRDFIVIGSQSILGQFPEAPAELLVSDEVDIYPRETRIGAFVATQYAADLSISSASSSESAHFR